MKTIQKVSALLVASASLSMAGVIDFYTDGEKKPSTSLNLMTIDSLTFSGKGEKKEIDFSGKAKQKSIKLSKIDQMKFSLKDKSKETMTVTVGEGVMAGKHTFKLSEIKKIEIVETDSDKDKDNDGLTDIEEIYKYDTNPNSTDTDGDGWNDSEELADGMYSPSNPTKFNPRIADVPGLRITLVKTPSITLNITTSEGVSGSETISNGSEVSRANSTSYEQTRSVDIMEGWKLSTTQSVEVGGGFKYSGSVTLGYNASYTSSTGMSWSSTEENKVAESYEKALANETSEGSEINGATVCMQVELENTSDIAFTIEALKLSASMYDIKDTAILKILADLSRDGDWSDITLKPAESVEANFCNNDVKVELIEDLIYNTSAIVLGSSTQKITIDGGSSDFTKVYTKVAAKTADITIDYGPGATGTQSVRYQVAANYRYNPDNKGSDDMYAKTSLADLLRNAHVDFKQDSVKGSSKQKLYGLASIDEYKYNLKDSAMWYVSIQRAADLKKGRNTMELYVLAHASYDLEKIFIGAGDAVHIFYSRDQDHDGVPFFTEHLFGSDDKKVDSDGDGLSDYDEINGWTKGKSKTKIYTNPANADTDGDGLNDKKDSEPTRRLILSKDASLSILQVFADSLMADSSALLNKDSVALAEADSFDVVVPAPSAFIKVVTNAEKVTWVKYTMNGKTYSVKPTVVDGKDVYIFETPKELKIFQNTDVTIEVKSGDETTVKTYTLSISSALSPPTNLKLGKSKDRTQIIVNFDHSKDPRVKGYVILRGDSAAALPESIQNNEKIVNNGMYKGFKSFVVDSSNSYADSVGGGSPYFAYCVYAYGMEGDSVAFSTGTETHKRSVGRIQLDIKMTDFGVFAEFDEISASVILYAGSGSYYPKICSWSGTGTTRYRSNLVDSLKYKLFFLSESQDVRDFRYKPYEGVYSTVVDRNGLSLFFEFYNRDDHYIRDIPNDQKICWSYYEMIKILENDDKGTGQVGGAPKQGENRFFVDKNKIEFDYTDGRFYCNVGHCESDIKVGFAFWITYDWVDDADFY